MMKTNFSTAGLLLGLILGPIAEDGMRDLLIVSNNAPVSYILTRPISLVLVVSIAFIIYISFKPQWRKIILNKEEKMSDTLIKNMALLSQNTLNGFGGIGEGVNASHSR